MNTATNSKPITLNPTQTAVLTHAIDHGNGKIEWFPENIKGGARQKVIEGLFKRAMIIGSDGDWIVTDAAYDALGRPHPGQNTATETATPAETKASKASRKASTTPKDAGTDSEQTAPRTRDNSKQALVIAMLKRPEGATIKEICELTQWQAHTVRGTFAGAFKKKLGLTITSDKTEGAERVYRIAETATPH